MIPIKSAAVPEEEQQITVAVSVSGDSDILCCHQNKQLPRVNVKENSLGLSAIHSASVFTTVRLDASVPTNIAATACACSNPQGITGRDNSAARSTLIHFKNIFSDAADKKPVRLDVALSESFSFTSQGMISVLFRKAVPLRQAQK